MVSQLISQRPIIDQTVNPRNIMVRPFDKYCLRRLANDFYAFSITYNFTEYISLNLVKFCRAFSILSGYF
jgi:hypothetical protein